MTTEPYDRNKEIERVTDELKSYANNWDVFVAEDGEKQIKLEFQKLVHEARMLSLVVTDIFPTGEPVFKRIKISMPAELVDVEAYSGISRIVTSLCRTLLIGWVSTIYSTTKEEHNTWIEYRELSSDEKRGIIKPKKK